MTADSYAAAFVARNAVHHTPCSCCSQCFAGQSGGRCEISEQTMLGRRVIEAACLWHVGYLELTSSAEPHVILARQLLHAIAGLVDCDATHVTAHKLVLVIVHITVAHCTPVTSPPHLQQALYR